MDEEISLRELIEVLIRGKEIIAIITIIALLISGVFSFLIISPTYQAKTTLLINQPNVRGQEADSNISAFLESISQYPNMTIETFRSQVKNPELLQKVLDTINEKIPTHRDGEGLTLAGLEQKINVQILNDTSLMEITVTDKEPAMAAEIANILSQKFIEFINEQNKQRMNQSLSYLEKQIQIEGEKLDEAVEELKVFLSQSPGVEELGRDIEAKLVQLTSFKATMVNQQLELEKLRASLASAQKELEQTPRTITTKRSIIDDPLLSGIIDDTENVDTGSLSKLELETEEINPTYVLLSETISSYKISIAQIETELDGLNREINKLTTQLEKLNSEYAEKLTLYEQLGERVNTLRGTYQAFARKYEEARIAASTEIGDNTLTIMSAAQTPENPISPKKKLNLAIAGVLGIMLGVFVVFFREFWVNSKPSK